MVEDNEAKGRENPWLHKNLGICVVGVLGNHNM
jgi:hypothetical protein